MLPYFRFSLHNYAHYNERLTTVIGVSSAMCKDISVLHTLIISYPYMNELLVGFIIYLLYTVECTP